MVTSGLMIGAYFSDIPISSSTPYILSAIPQISYSNITPIMDTVNWVEISGSFIAAGNEKYITIGNFKSDSQTAIDTQHTYNYNKSAYYVIDDISVTEQIDVDAGPSKEICAMDSVRLEALVIPGVQYTWWPSTGLSNAGSAQPVASPDQTTRYYLTLSDTSGKACLGNIIDSITVIVQDCRIDLSDIIIPTVIQQGQTFTLENVKDALSLSVFDNRGRLVFNASNYQNSFNTSTLDAGIYLFLLHDEITNQERRIKVLVFK